MFRDDHPLCLHCDAGLDKRGGRWVCSECNSKLVPAHDLRDALNEVSPDDMRELEQRLIPAPRIAALRRTCPLCKTQMTPFSILDVAVDACSAHGVWIHRIDDTTIVLRNEAMYNARHSPIPRGAYVPLGIGIIFGALLSPWLDRRRLRKDIERTSPPKAKK